MDWFFNSITKMSVIDQIKLMYSTYINNCTHIDKVEMKSFLKTLRAPPSSSLLTQYTFSYIPDDTFNTYT